MRRFFMFVGVVMVALCVVGGSTVLAQEKPAPPAGQAASADPISGDWDGLVPDQNVPFTLKLKLENDKLSGEVGGGQGGTPLSGTWVAGESKMTISFTYVDGSAIEMTGVVNGDQMTGTLLYGGQMTMNWSARKHAK